MSAATDAFAIWTAVALPVIALGAWLAIRVELALRRRKVRGWGIELARRLELQLDEQDHGTQLHGMWRKVPVRLVPRRNWIEVHARLPSSAASPFRIDVMAQGARATEADLRRAKDVKIGDPVLDAAWLIRAENPREAARLLLQPLLREPLLRFISKRQGARLHEEGVAFLCQPKAERAELQASLHEAVELVSAVAQAMAEPVAVPLPLEEPLPAPHPKALAAAAPVVFLSPAERYVRSRAWRPLWFVLASLSLMSSVVVCTQAPLFGLPLPVLFLWATSRLQQSGCCPACGANVIPPPPDDGRFPPHHLSLRSCFNCKALLFEPG